MRFIDIVLKSIGSVLNLNFDGYEVIIVDNASTDGSFEVIKKYVEEHKPSGVRVKFVTSDANRGYAGGMNLGWDARDGDSKYVAFLNNDLIAEPESLGKIIEYMENDEKTAAISGLIYHGDGKTIYSAGSWIDELLVSGGICNGLTINKCPEINKEHLCTYADGAYMVVRVGSIKNSMPNGKPFLDETFMYLDDNLLGLILWNNGYRVKYIPVDAGTHFVSMTARGSTGGYYGTRGSTALRYIVKTKYSHISWLWLLRRRLYYFIDSNRYKAVRDGIRLSRNLIWIIGTLNLYCAPYVKVNALNAIAELTLIRYLLKRGSIYTVKPEDLVYDPAKCN
jgi:GT2 family glycosyltransferase